MQTSYLKPSHFVTPRTMDDATFYAGGAPIEKPAEPTTHTVDKVIMALSVVAIIVVATLIATGN